MLSYLLPSHVAERTLVEHGLLATGMQVFFAESLDPSPADLQRARPTVFFSLPRLWVKFQQGVFAKMPPPSERLLKIPILRGIVKKKILRRARASGIALRRRRRADAARPARLAASWACRSSRSTA